MILCVVVCVCVWTPLPCFLAWEKGTEDPGSPQDVVDSPPVTPNSTSGVAPDLPAVTDWRGDPAALHPQEICVLFSVCAWQDSECLGCKVWSRESL